MRVKPGDKIMKIKRRTWIWMNYNWLFSNEIICLNSKRPLYIQEVFITTRDSFENFKNNVLIFKAHPHKVLA
jgi:hypothetical protein